jgi:ribosome modulation factor
MITEKEFTRAYLAGFTGRRNGKKEKDNPYRDKPSQAVLRDQWVLGYHASSQDKVQQG